MTQDQGTVKAPTTANAPAVVPTEADSAGLTEAEATRRLAQYGENALVEHHHSASASAFAFAFALASASHFAFAFASSHSGKYTRLCKGVI